MNRDSGIWVERPIAIVSKGAKTRKRKRDQLAAISPVLDGVEASGCPLLRHDYPDLLTLT